MLSCYIFSIWGLGSDTVQLDADDYCQFLYPVLFSVAIVVHIGDVLVCNIATSEYCSCFQFLSFSVTAHSR